MCFTSYLLTYPSTCVSGIPVSGRNMLTSWHGNHDDVIKWKHFPRYWPFVRGIHRSPVKSPHKGQWRGALIFSLICVWISGLVNNRETGDLRRHRDHYNVTVMRFRITADGLPSLTTSTKLWCFKKLLNKQLSCRWFEAIWHSYDVTVMIWTYEHFVGSVNCFCSVWQLWKKCHMESCYITMRCRFMISSWSANKIDEWNKIWFISIWSSKIINWKYILKYPY